MSDALRSGGRWVLFVDDSALARRAASEELGAHGLHVIAVGSLAEARGVDPAGLDAALLDIELDDGSGTELAALLRAARPELPIAFLTGGAEAGRLEQAARFGPIFAKRDGVGAPAKWIALHAGE